MLPSTFITFLDINTSSPVLGFFQPPSQCHSPDLLSMKFFHPSRRSGPRYVPAVGCALFMPAVGYALFMPAVGYALFMPAVGYALFMPAVGYALLTCCGSALLASFHQDHPSVHVSAFTLSCVRSPASLFCECVSLAPRAPYTLWCLGSPRACVVHVLTHVLSSARFTCCAWSGVTQHHSLPSPPRAARVEGVVSRLVVNSDMP